MDVVLSKYNVLFKGETGETHLFNSCTRALVTLDENGERAYAALRDRKPLRDEVLLREFLRGRFAVRADIEEERWVRTSYYASRYSQCSVGLTIAPTLRCNFGCSYCFEGEQASEDMTEKTMDDICRYVEMMSPAVRRLGITWYGGEPPLDGAGFPCG